MKKVIAIMLLSVMLTACTGVGSEDVTETTVHVCETCVNCETGSGEGEPDVTETVETSETTTVEVSEPVETTVPREVSPEELIEAFNDGVRAQAVAYAGLIAYIDMDIETMKRLMVTQEEAELYLSGYAMEGYGHLCDELMLWEKEAKIIWEETEGWHDLTEMEQKLKKGRSFETIVYTGLDPWQSGYTSRDGYAGFAYDIRCVINTTFWISISIVKSEDEWKIYAIGCGR
ncbi:MAG: hypothetical protein FWD34_10780 [Oscillospiraceae bacterium]|nr:hypothetical protein [Oscillospiraceae bacterium]